MKKLLILLVFVANSFAMDDLGPRHFKLAYKLQKPIVVYLYKDECKYCKAFQSSSLSNPLVSSLLKNEYIATKINVGAVQSPFPFRITPTLVFIDHNAQALAQSVEGNVDPASLANYLENIASDYKKIR